MRGGYKILRIFYVCFLLLGVFYKIESRGMLNVNSVKKVVRPVTRRLRSIKEGKLPSRKIMKSCYNLTQFDIVFFKRF